MHDVISPPPASDRPATLSARHSITRFGSALFLACTLMACGAICSATAGETAPSIPIPAPAASGDPAATASAPVQDEAEIAKLLKEILAERAELAAMRREHRQKIEELQASQFILQRSIAADDEEIARLQKEAAGQAIVTDARRAELTRLQAVSKQWLAALRDYAQTLLAQVSASIDQDRAARLQAVQIAAKEMNAPGATPADALQKINRLQEAEESLGRTIEMVPVRVAENKEVDGVRIGGVLILAPLDNGSALAAGPGSAPQAQTPVDAAHASGIPLALQILKRRRSPDFSDLFFPALPLNAPATLSNAPTPATPAPATPAPSPARAGAGEAAP